MKDEFELRDNGSIEDIDLDHHSHGAPECDGCGCDHCHEESEEDKKLEYILLAIGGAALAVSFLPFLGSFVRDILRIGCAVFCAYFTALDAFEGIKKKKIKESLLLIIAVIAAIILKDFFEAAAVSFLFRIGEFFEEFASRRSRKSIESLYSIVSDTGHLVLPEGGYKTIDADDIKPGMKLALLPHEILPVDGRIIHGEGTLDTSAITGESLPAEVGPGSKIISGCKNGNSTLYYEATALKAQSGAEKIISLVNEATHRKGESQRFIEKFAKYYTPAIIIASVLVAVIFSIITKRVGPSVHRALVLLVAACPCAIVLSVPLAFVSAMGSAAKSGLIIKGSNFIETLASADCAAFDKTGTLTTGTPEVGRVYTAYGISEKELLTLAAKCEMYSTHPIAKAIVRKAGNPKFSNIMNFTEIPGGGSSIDTPQGKVTAGGKRLMMSIGADTSSFPDVPVYIALKNKVLGAIEITGEIRADAKESVRELRKLGVKKLFMLTGDSEKSAKEVSSALGLDGYRHSLLPENKLTALEDIKSGADKVIYVGDGINDAPVLAYADVGVAMGLSAQAAGEAADVIITKPGIASLVAAVKKSKKTMGVLKENVIFALAVKLAVIILGIIGIAPMWLAVVADVGTMLACVANSARLISSESASKRK